MQNSRLKTISFSICLTLGMMGMGCAPKGPIPMTATQRSASTIDEAIAFVDKPSPGDMTGNGPLFDLQCYFRLDVLQKKHQANHTFRASDADAWAACMRDEKRSMYARLCAAYFLLDTLPEARTFVESQLKSDNLRYRHNAAEVVHLYVDRDATKEWGIGVLIEMLGNGSLDGGVESSSSGEFPEGDRFDNMHTPLDRICWSMGFIKQKQAVPALISVLHRRPGTSGAAFALGEIGDRRAIPVLIQVIQDRSGYAQFVYSAVGQLKSKEAVPLLIARLNDSAMNNSMYGMETSALLEALLAIGDPASIAPINAYIDSDAPAESKAVARRVLVQLQSVDPVSELLRMFDAEKYEPERSELILALATYHDDRSVSKLAAIACTFDSAFMRRQAIFGLQKIGNRRSLLILASLLNQTFPKALISDWGWKETPKFDVYFPELIEDCLKECTEQNFGRDRRKWEEWITRNVALK